MPCGAALPRPWSPSLSLHRYAELEKDVKNGMSHRAVALGMLKKHLQDNAADILEQIAASPAKKARVEAPPTTDA